MEKKILSRRATDFLNDTDIGKEITDYLDYIMQDAMEDSYLTLKKIRKDYRYLQDENRRLKDEISRLRRG